MLAFSSPGIDSSIFKYTPTFKKTGVDLYTFIICRDMKKKVAEICSVLDIKSIPKKLFNDYLLNDDFEKTLYTDKFELLFIGLNKAKNCSINDIYKTYGKLGVVCSKEINKNNNSCIYIIDGSENEVRNNVISYILGFFNFTDFKTGGDFKLQKKGINYFYCPKKRFKSVINDAIYIGCVQNEIRCLINTPANILNYASYIEYIKKNLPKEVSIKVLNEKQMKKLGLNLILGVGQGSANKSGLIILEYNHVKLGSKEKPICLIGKGVMFDSGGYNLKHGDFSIMKYDMAGSAIVFGIFKLLSHFQLGGKYIGLLPIVENMISDKAIRPGDILVSYNKKTVEIIDTDAEGRLILADSLAYSEKFKPYMCIDIATLTGQASSIFGNKSSVIMGNNNKYVQKMIHAGKMNHENIWELPMWEEYVSLTKSTIADYKNYSYESSADTIMAGAFLSNFVPKGVNWIHLDIAGVDSIQKDSETRFYGALGESMRSIFYFLENFKKEVYE